MCAKSETEASMEMPLNTEQKKLSYEPVAEMDIKIRPPSATGEKTCCKGVGLMGGRGGEGGRGDLT